MQQTVYLGLPDDSVRNSVVLFQLLGPTTLFFFLFFFSLSLFLWYSMFGWKNFIRVYNEAEREA